LRILGDADFQAGKLDTGYLDRLLAKGTSAGTSRAAGRGVEEKAEVLETIAAIAAGMFAVLDPALPVSKNGSTTTTGSPAITPVPSNWKQKGRSEALR